MEYPKWVPSKEHGSVLVQNSEQETLVLEGRALVRVVKSAQDCTVEVVGAKPEGLGRRIVKALVGQ